MSLLDSIDKDSKLNLEAYSETVYPFCHFHCAPLVSLTTQDYSFVQAPRPELYSSKVDFAELHNIAGEASRCGPALETTALCRGSAHRDGAGPRA